MKTFFTCFFIFPILSAGAQTVSLDNTFGNSGVVITPNTTEINVVTTASDGSVFSAGYTIQNGGIGIYHLTVSKHNSNGSIASGFGTNGVVTTAVNYSEMPYDIVLQPDGKILVGGSAYLGPTQSGPGDYRTFVVRYLPNGTLDSGFGTNGIFLFDHYDSHLNSILLQSNGSILLAGNAGYQCCITKLTSSGVLDTSYGSGTGVKYIGDANYQLICWGGIMLSDGNTLVYGYENSDWSNTKITCAKVNSQGNFVTAFGQGGKAIFDTFDSDTVIDPVVELVSKAVELPGGKIILNAQSLTGTILKLQANGTLDPAFATNGILTHTHRSQDMRIQPDGKILLGGSKLISDYNYGFVITRLNTDGTLDQNFNGNGIFTADISPYSEYFQSMTLATPTKLIVGGSSRFTGDDASFMLVGIDMSQTVGISEHTLETISVYPNPFNDQLTFSVPASELSGITLFDASGREVKRFEAVENNSLQLGDLANGMYHLVFYVKSGEQQRVAVVKH